MMRIEPVAVAAAVVGFMPMVGVLGLPLGVVALRRIDRAEPKRLGKAAAWFGLVWGGMWIVFIVVQTGH